jgi:hypothetical protein
MNRLALVGIALLAACGNKYGASICDTIPAPAACMITCDPNPGAPNSCPAGYHCSPDGTCDAQCTPTGGECGDGYQCTDDGRCEGTGSGMDVDAAPCPAVHLTPMKTTPSIELVLDRSGSMGGTDIAPTRYGAMHTGLTGATGAITTTQANVYFGALLFSGDQCPLAMAGFSTPRALNNATAIDTLIAGHAPGGNTPTADAIALATADFNLNPPPAGSPPIILLATDGEPNSCTGTVEASPTFPQSTGAVAAAFGNTGAAGSIRTFIIGLGNPPLNPVYLQAIANAGVNMTGAMFYSASDPASLVAGFNAIINGVISCDLTITGTVGSGCTSNGTVTLNGTQLMCGTDWTVDANGMTIHLLGQACTNLKTANNPVLDAAFPCGSVIF